MESCISAGIGSCVGIFGTAGSTTVDVRKKSKGILIKGGYYTIQSTVTVYVSQHTNIESDHCCSTVSTVPVSLARSLSQPALFFGYRYCR